MLDFDTITKELIESFKQQKKQTSQAIAQKESKALSATDHCFLALLMDNENIIKSLLGEVDFNAVNANGLTLIDVAEQLGRENIVKLLKDNKSSKPNPKSTKR